MPDITIADLTGGRNGIDFPAALAPNQAVEMVNIDWQDGSALAHKRFGASELALTGGTFGGTIYSMFRHVPKGVETAAELWTVDNAGNFNRLAGGTTWAAVTLDDAISGNYQDVQFCSFNGKLFIAYNSGVNRLHVWDPTLSLVRRVGLAAPGVPTAANSGGAGSYAALTRYYRVRVIQWDATNSILYRRSEPSPSVAFTPDGAHASVTITLGTLPGEHETHWEVEMSLDNSNFFVLYGALKAGASAPIAIATTTAVDTTPATAAGYLPFTSADGIGLYTLPISVKFLSTDGNRLLMANTNQTVGPTSRIYFTPVLGSLDSGDDERVENTATLKGWVDLNEKDGGQITAISYPVQGVILGFKYRQTWTLTPTSDNTAPYLPRKISDTTGCIYAKSLVMAEDYQGNAALYTMSHRGPYQYGIYGLVYCGRDVWDQWKGWNGLSAMNLGATTLVCHGVWHTDVNQIWWWIPTGTANTPNLKLMVDVRKQTLIDPETGRYNQYGFRGGWAIHNGKSAQAICSAMFSNTVGATMSIDLKPYVSYLAA